MVYWPLTQRRLVMHLKVGHHTLATLMAIGLFSACVPGGPASAAPVTREDAAQHMTDVVDPPELTLEPAALAADSGPGRALQAASAAQGGLMRADQAHSPSREATQTKVAPQNSMAAPSGASPGPDLAADIRSTVKESVRPLHDQLVASGAVDAWKELKTDLGLDTGKWDTDGTPGANPMAPGREPSGSPGWRDAAQPPKTAAQAQADRELASHMLEKLVDEVKPWAISLLGLYLLGYLIKAGIGHSQRKSIRRRERETARVLRRAGSKVTSVKPDA